MKLLTLHGGLNTRYRIAIHALIKQRSQLFACARRAALLRRNPWLLPGQHIQMIGHNAGSVIVVTERAFDLPAVEAGGLRQPVATDLRVCFHQRRGTNQVANQFDHLRALAGIGEVFAGHWFPRDGGGVTGVLSPRT